MSADTVQDATWTATAFRNLAAHLEGRGFDEVYIESDNAYHYHNNYVFSDIAFDFVRALRLRAFGWQYCEPGEGKDEVDGHFGARARASFVHPCADARRALPRRGYGRRVHQAREDPRQA